MHNVGSGVMVLALSAAVGMAQQTPDANTTSLRVPKGWGTWVIAPECYQAAHIYQQAGGDAREEPVGKIEYRDGQAAERVSRLKECARVKVLGHDGRVLADGFVASELAERTEAEINWDIREAERQAEIARKSIEETRRRTAAIESGMEAEAAAMAKLPRLYSERTARESRAVQELNEMAERRGLPTADTRERGSVFVGSDRQCAVEFQQAQAMSGIEKRKNSAELIAYGCGVSIEGRSPYAKKVREDRGFCEVEIKSGTHAGELGWAPCGWLHAPTEP